MSSDIAYQVLDLIEETQTVDRVNGHAPKNLRALEQQSSATNDRNRHDDAFNFSNEPIVCCSHNLSELINPLAISLHFNTSGPSHPVKGLRKLNRYLLTSTGLRSPTSIWAFTFATPYPFL
jgi:hypothetical protein